MKLGYWDIRGLADPIRFLLHYKKVAFEDKRYAFTSGEWQKDKFNLGLDFPNLPYLFDGDVRITQSTTILRYLAEKYHLDGKTPEEKLKVSLVEQQIIDLRWMLIRSCVFEEDLVKARVEFSKTAPVQLKLIEKFLGDRKFLVGDSLTYVDFLFSETYDFFRYFVPNVCKDFPTLKAHQGRILGLPELQGYLTSPTYVRWPVFGPIAKFGGGGEEPERD